MNELNFIRKYYQPIQPSVSEKDARIKYQEIQPGKDLENFVCCYWQLKTKRPLNQEYVYRVVSDGCIDVFFNHQNPAESFVMGFCRKYTEFSIGKEFNYIGIRFWPSIFPLLFGVDAKGLSNQYQDLKAVLPDFSQWIKKSISNALSLQQVGEEINQQLIGRVKDSAISCDQRFLEALHLILLKKGNLNTEKDLLTGLSSRQLRRIFNYYIGTTAKSFSNVVRFQHILNAQPSKQSLRENKLYFDVGFFDQAHFIKNFKTYYGVTPSEAFD